MYYTLLIILLSIYTTTYTMTDISVTITGFSQTIQSSFDALKSQNADEIFELQKTISRLQDRITELERPTQDDPLLTQERFLEILLEEDLEPRKRTKNGCISVWFTGVGGRKKKMTLCGCPGAVKKVIVGTQEIWLGTNVDDTDIFTNANIPIGDLGVTRVHCGGNSGRFYTTEPVHESTLHKVIAELKK